MKSIYRAIGALALLSSPIFVAVGLSAQENQPLVEVPKPAPSPEPQFLQGEGETPWLYEGSNVPVDREWQFGAMDNGVRYAVRKNGVPPGQVSIRVRIDAGSLHEEDSEQGYAHLLEHLLFRESKHLGVGEAIPNWQRLGASLGHDTNATTSPTQTVYNINLPSVTLPNLEESFELLSGMIREPVLSDANVGAEVPIVLAEMREQGGASQRVQEATLATLFAGQRLENRRPIGTPETLNAATGASVEAFHSRWYRPENTVIVAVGDVDPLLLAQHIETYFGDWVGQGDPAPAPDFGDPIPPAGSEGPNPVGELTIINEADLPRTLTYAVMRPWRPVMDTIVYNEGLMIEAVGQAIINRRLETRARGGGSFLYAQVQQEDISRSTDATIVSFAPLGEDWEGALSDVRAVIADALASPPSQEEIDREVAEFDTAFASEVEQSRVQAGSRLADNIVRAVDIRETVASPEIALEIFRGTGPRFNPDEVFAATEKLFRGDVVRGTYVTPEVGEAEEAAFRLALAKDAVADSNARLANRTISFDELPAIGPAGTIAERKNIGLLDIEQITFENGVRAILWSNNDEPGRVSAKVRFGGGYRTFEADEAPYIPIGQVALVSSGLGEIDENDLDRLATGRKMEFDFAIDEAVFTFTAQTRSVDVQDQLYLFAAKLGMPRWDPNPVLRAKAAAEIGYASFSSSPSAVLARDLDYFLRNNDARWSTPKPEETATVTPEGFRQVWEPKLQEGPIEVLVFGEFDREAVVETLRETFGALPPSAPLTPQVAGRLPEFPASSPSATVLTHRGDANQAAAVVAWPTLGGTARLRESRQLEILAKVFSNKLLDALREKLGASYAPQAVSRWPADLPQGGMIMALAQLEPKDVPVFFAEADRIAQDLANTPLTEDEIARATQPLGQLYSRAATSNLFWLFQLEGVSTDPTRIQLVRTLLADYSQTRPEIMQLLARRYLAARPGWQLAVVPDGYDLEQVERSIQQPAPPAVVGR